MASAARLNAPFNGLGGTSAKSKAPRPQLGPVQSLTVFQRDGPANLL